MGIGHAVIERDGTTVEILEEHAEVWIVVDESSLGVRDHNQRAACASIGHVITALEDAGYTITAPDWRALAEKQLPQVHPYQFYDAKKFDAEAGDG